jgi:phosphoribosylformylglycinamidine (FGAM) synthase-like enzyme
VETSPAPHFDLEKEYALHQTIKTLIQSELINAAHDCSDGGLFIALAEMSFPRGLGFDIVTDSEIREDAFLFGESQGRVVVTVTEENEEKFIEYLLESGINFTLLGHVTKGKFMIDEDHCGFCHELKDIYDSALQTYLEK